MKNATAYEKKVKKLLSGMDRSREAGGEEQDPAWVLVRAVFEADAWPELAETAVEALRREFVDINELRVAPPKDIVECVGRDYPRVRAKARQVTEVLNEIYRRQNRITTEYLGAMAKRELRRHLQELGLEPFPAALVTLRAFGGHAVAVDESLVELLRMDELVHPESDVPDVQGFLERIIPQKDAEAAHAFFREHVRANADRLARKRQAEAERAEAERKKAEEEAAEKKRREEEKAAEEAVRAEEAKKAKKSKKSKKAKKARKTGRKTQAAKKSPKSSKGEPAKSASKSAGKSGGSGTAKKPRRKAKATSAKTAGKGRKSKSSKASRKRTGASRSASTKRAGRKK